MFKSYDVVRVGSILDKVTVMIESPNRRRPPKVGDLATIVAVYDAPSSKLVPQLAAVFINNAARDQTIEDNGFTLAALPDATQAAARPSSCPDVHYSSRRRCESVHQRQTRP